MEEQLKKYGISKELFLKVTQFIKLQVDLNMVNTITDQEQIAAEILIMASESLKANAGENTLPIQHVTAPLLNYSFRDENSELQHCQVDIRNAEAMLGNMMTRLNEVNRFIAEFTSNGR